MLFYVLRIVVEHNRADRKRDYPPLPKNRRPRFQIDPELADVVRQNRDGAARSFDTCFLRILGSAMARTARPRRGRPAHTDDPPVLLSTSIPTSTDRLLRDMSEKLSRPRSQLLSEAIRAYARRFPEINTRTK